VFTDRLGIPYATKTEYVLECLPGDIEQETVAGGSRKQRLGDPRPADPGDATQDSPLPTAVSPAQGHPVDTA
jgi:hypothetical protein